MRWIVTNRIPFTRLTLVVALVASVLIVAGTDVRAQEPGTPTADPIPVEEMPAGFVDGWPVGAEDPDNGATQSSANDTHDADDGRSRMGPMSEQNALATPKMRYFGHGAYNAIVTAAESVDADCEITTQGRVALMLAPIFKESSNATKPTDAPSPMTLSRYDEWNGTRNGATNKNANYGLYAFENPNSAYPRAYWHPGIGIWQYDSAGVGSPYTAAERMDTGIVGKNVAEVMFRNYCAHMNNRDRGDTLAESGQKARYEAWRDWGKPCGLCQEAFDDLSKHRDPNKPSGFRYLELVSGIDRLGGTQRRNCSISGGSQVPCWYVDPARAQGANWWTGEPNDGDPTSGMAPLSHPFYVYKSGGREHRHWLREDTGYSIDISAWRTLYRNARPRSNQSGSGLTWKRSSGLCDVTADRGRCGGSTPPHTDADPTAPNGVKISFHVVNGTTYQPLTGDFNGDGLSDILWYAPGSTPDYVWWSNRNGGFTSTSVVVGGDYKRVCRALR